MMPLWYLILYVVSNHLRLGTPKFIININLPVVTLANRKVHTDGPAACYRSPVVIIGGGFARLLVTLSGGLRVSPLVQYEPVLVHKSGSRCHSSNLVSWLLGERTERYSNKPLAGQHNTTLNCTFIGTVMITATDQLVSRVHCPFPLTNHNMCLLTTGSSIIRPRATETGETPSTLHWCRDQDLVSRHSSITGGYFIVSPLTLNSVVQRYDTVGKRTVHVHCSVVLNGKVLNRSRYTAKPVNGYYRKVDIYNSLLSVYYLSE